MSEAHDSAATPAATPAATTAPAAAAPVASSAQLLMQEILKDRKRDRRATYFKYGLMGCIAAGYLAALSVGMRAGADSSADTDGGYVAMVRVEGEIGPGKEASAEKLNPLLDKAFADSKAKGVVLLVNSPGGTPVQSSLVHDRILELKKKHNKRVVAIGEDLVTSGAYMIASAADEIVVNRSTITGSIGVISRGFGFTGAMEKLGIERRVLTAGESKNMLDPFSPETEAARVKQSRLLAGIHQHFIQTVEAGRGAKLKKDVPGLYSGTVWTGEEALNFGVVDKLGDLASVKAAFGVKHAKVFAPQKSLLETIAAGAGVKVLQQVLPLAQGPSIQAMPE